MKGIGYWFMALGAGFALIGMVWGVQMSATGDFALAPAHGHLNLIGWVTFAIWGLYYVLTPDAAETGLARAHLGLAVLTVLVMVPGIAMAIRESGETLAKVGSVLAILSMALFLVNVLRHGVGQRA